jgi:nucleotide-binding universal stress UspA family protein
MAIAPHVMRRPQPARDLRLGQEAAELAPAAADCDADFRVVGIRGRGAWRTAVLGSVSVAVAHLAPCPVIVVPDRDDAEMHARTHWAAANRQ